MRQVRPCPLTADENGRSFRHRGSRPSATWIVGANRPQEASMEPLNLLRLVPRPFARPLSAREYSRVGRAACFGGLVVLLIAWISLPIFEQVAHAQSTQQPIPAIMALEQHPACSDVELGGLDIDFG